VGTLYRVGDDRDLVRAVDDLIRDYELWCRRVVKAQEMLSWDGDAARLVQLYRELAGKAPQFT
jgi:glycogen(starch) synthase